MKCQRLFANSTGGRAELTLGQSHAILIVNDGSDCSAGAHDRAASDGTRRRSGPR